MLGFSVGGSENLDGWTDSAGYEQRREVMGAFLEAAKDVGIFSWVGWCCGMARV